MSTQYVSRGAAARRFRAYHAVAWLALAGFVLAACMSSLRAPPPASPAPAELIFGDRAGDLPQGVLDAFRRETGITVTRVLYGSPEEAVADIRAGIRYDVLVVESQYIPQLAREGRLAELDHRSLPNFKNISANFRDLTYDPGNRHSLPHNWGTVGLVVRADLVVPPVRRWADLWDRRYARRAAICLGRPREVIALTLKSLGYSANSEDPRELEAALARLLELRPSVQFVEDFNPGTSADALAAGQLVIAMGCADDVLQGRQKQSSIAYVLPEEGALLWGDVLVVLAGSSRRAEAHAFLNFLMRPDIAARIANGSGFATPNEAARPYIAPEIARDTAVYPPDAILRNAEIILPLSTEGQALYDRIWSRFVDAGRP
jgi:spermidine/putrescine transport system substrate-binding protein